MIYRQCRHALTAAGIVYLLAILSLVVPPVQRKYVFMNHPLELP